MKMNKITIEKVYNGYVIKGEDDDCDSNRVIEIKEDNLKQEQLALADLFYFIRDYFEVYNDKHKNQYLDITVTDGD